ncbi:MAG: type II toxin-antitoxin system RelE/ParE family toxin [Pirellulales bacterium]|nr:type II toxin-antitoxin system RelE/ParE family toxin [Pirellulales bacterium]
MPETEVRVFRDLDGSVPLLEWLDDLSVSEPKAHRKCLARILELAERGNEMRRPHADYLRDAIYELRATLGNTQYRLLYFFSGKHVVTLSHGIIKERVVPDEEIELAIERRALVQKHPDDFTATFDV